MRKIRILLSVLCVALFAVFVIVSVFESIDQNNMPFHLQITTDKSTENINCWENSSGQLYAFVPGYAGMDSVKIKTDTATSVLIDSKKIYDGMTCNDFDTDKELKITYSSFGKKVTKNITFLKSGNLPTMYVNTESGSMDYINEKKDNNETGSFKIYTSQGDVNASGNLESVSGRGNATWNYFDKKPYSITLKSSEDLLGMGKAQKWVLLSNATDSSNMRNKLIFDYARKIGLLSPQCEWVDLYLNGEYAGLYLLSRRNDSYFTENNSFKGEGFLVSLEGKDRLIKQNNPYIVTKENQALRIHSSTIDSEKIESIWQSAENAILSENGIDKESGKHWRELIDTDSWVKKYLIEEVFGNLDACYLSQYFYYDNDDNNKIFSGPVWDYDMTIGNQTEWSLSFTDIFVANRLDVGGGDFTPWFSSLYQNDEFFKQIVNLYKTEFSPQISDFLDNRLNEYSQYISFSDKMDRIRWQEYRSDDLGTQVRYIKNYMSDRMEFLNNVWINNKEYVALKLNSGSGHFGYWMVPVGKTINEVPVLKDTIYEKFSGWYYADTGKPFDITEPIYEDTEINAKWQDSTYKRTEQIIKLIPIAVIAVLFIIMFVIEIKRILRKG